MRWRMEYINKGLANHGKADRAIKKERYNFTATEKVIKENKIKL